MTWRERLLSTDSAIGRGFRGGLLVAIALELVAYLVIARDLRDIPWDWRERLWPAAVAVVLFLVVARGDRATLGLTLPSRRGLVRALRWLAILGGIALALIAVALLVMKLTGIPFRTHTLPRSEARTWMFHACVIAPLVEEPIYRLVLVPPLARRIGRWPTILASGVAFGALHFRYGNPSPDNFVGGYLLAWSYLESESILAPIALHSLGNACVGVFLLLSASR